MKILRQETLEHEGNDCMIYDSLLLYEFCGKYAVVWNDFKTGWFGCSTKNSVRVLDTLEEATEEFERMIKVLY